MSTPEIELYYYDGANYTTFNAPIQSISISRGRSRQLNRFESGSATINFRDSDRQLDPLNDDSPLQSLLVPRLPFEILADSVPIYSGVVNDWDIQYDLVGQNIVTASCSDLLSVLSNLTFVEELATVAEGCDDRLNFVVNHFSLTIDTNFDVGNANLGPYPIPVNTQATDYLFDIAFADQGNLFVSADNTLTFVAKYGRDATSLLTFADDGTGINYSSLQNEYGDELLYNEAAITSPVGFGKDENASSIASFGRSVFTYAKALNQFATDPIWIAQSIVNLYGEPIVRFTGLSVELAGLSSSDQADVLGLDLADQVSVKKSFDVGTPSSITQDVIVTGIQHRIVPGSHVVQFTFEPTPYRQSLELDDATEGLLDTAILG